MMAGALQEEKLFQASYAFEQATDWHKIKPDI
jgi:Asp-tRNA(Asn)/Glu-tRNA(Gln) amidotransferase A subunit family amidase